MVRRFYVVGIGLLGGLVLTGDWQAADHAQSAESAGAANAIKAEEAAEGWLLLWDGQTLFGWRAAPEAAWQPAEGELRAHVAQAAKPGQTTKADEVRKPADTAKSEDAAKPAPSAADQPAKLISTSEWADFVLRMDFRAEPGAQASLWLRTSAETEAPRGAKAKEPTVQGDPPHCSKEISGGAETDGYELMLASEDPAAWPVGSLKGRKKAQTAALPPGWHSLEARLEGGTIAVRLDGQEVLRYDDPKPIRRGYLALQVQNGSAAFRNLKLRPLGLRSIFNGKDLTGWKQYPQTPTKCTVTPEGHLRVQGGRGQLESEGQYADFTLQLDVFVNGQGLNSGVFFRCIPGEMMNGYECQIHNGFLDGDRNKPKDCGTGGIFRRQNARRVVADDFQWFTLTIHAQGTHVATWVNGFQTVDWTDARPPDPNPRKGRRLEPGTLQIQGHDPSTDLMFRNIRIVELPQR